MPFQHVWSSSVSPAEVKQWRGDKSGGIVVALLTSEQTVVASSRGHMSEAM